MALLKLKANAAGTDREAEVAAVVDRIEQLARVARVCGSCGVEFPGRLDDPTETRTTLGGEIVAYGTCPDCTGREGDRWPLAVVLGVSVSDLALHGLTATMFADLPWSHPGRPNLRPWDHLDVAKLAEQYMANRADVERRRGGPCRFCGSTLANPGSGWWTVRGGVCCWGCDDAFEPRSATFDEVGARRFVAATLAGIPHEYIAALPQGFAQAVGFRWWDASGADGDPAPWAFIDLDVLRRRAMEWLTEMRWRHVSSYRPELAGEVAW